MVKLIKKRTSGYTNVSNALVTDKRLSWKARGIFIYLWCQADNWQFYVEELVRHSTDGRDSLQNGLKELEKYGYLVRKNKQTDSGKFGGIMWILSDNPSNGKSVGRKTRWTGNPPLTNNNNNYYQEQQLTRDIGQVEPDHHLQQRKQVIDYLNSKLGTSYRANASKNKRLIDARLREGYQLQDFKKVIDHKYTDWHDDQQMSKYLRPETLFGTKFEGYLNEKQTASVLLTSEERDGHFG